MIGRICVHRSFIPQRNFLGFRKRPRYPKLSNVRPPLPPPSRGSPDGFSYLSDLKNQEVKSYIKAENEYFENKRIEWSNLHDKTLRQLREVCTVEDPAAFDPPPEISNGYAYFLHDGVYYRQPYNSQNSFDSNIISQRYVREQSPYPTHSLPQLDLSQAQPILDPSDLPPGISISNVALSFDHSMLGYIERRVGEESGTLRFKDLRTGDLIRKHTVTNVVNFVWANNGKSVILTKMNAQLRPHQVYVHNLPTAEDKLLFEEKDDRYFVDVSLTKDKKFITINSNSRSSSEVHIIDGNWDFTTPQPPNIQIICPRRQGVEYFIDHHGDKIYIVTNAFDGVDFTLAHAPARDPSEHNWKKLLDLDSAHKLEDVDVFHDHVVLYTKKDGLPSVLVHEIPTSETHVVPLPEPICTVIPGVNREFYTDNVRFNVICAGYREIVYEYRFKQKKLLEVRKVPIPGFHREDYVMSRIHVSVPIEDGDTDDLPNILPVTLFHKSDVSISNVEEFASVQVQSGRTPPVTASDGRVLIQAYQSYGMEATLPFDPVYMPLLVNGWIIATCHGVGGSEFGKGWYRRGIGAKGKTRSINHVLHFVNMLSRYSPNTSISGLGISAGGCIMGSVFGMSWKKDQSGDLTNPISAVVLHVPFLDPLTAMSDPSEALTTTEQEEWGNPLHEKQDEELMKRYSPYELIPESDTDGNKNTPSILLTSGLLDQRVPFWHPLKYAARIRTRLPNIYGSESQDGKLFILTREDGGHFEDTSESSLEDSAWWISFLLHEVEKRNNY